MRAPFQILAIPYRIVDGTPMYCVFHRADDDQWQFIAGGGEDNETPLAAAKEKPLRRGGVHSTQVAWIEKSVVYSSYDHIRNASQTLGQQHLCNS